METFRSCWQTYELSTECRPAHLPFPRCLLQQKMQAVSALTDMVLACRRRTQHVRVILYASRRCPLAIWSYLTANKSAKNASWHCVQVAGINKRVRQVSASWALINNTGKGRVLHILFSSFRVCMFTFLHARSPNCSRQHAGP